MIISHNPDANKVKTIIDNSEQKAAKWLKDLDTNEFWYWPADWQSHHNNACCMDLV